MKIIRLLFLLSFINVSYAAETGNTLLNHATADDWFTKGYFQGYVVGIIEANVLKVCIPNKVTLNQAALVTKKYMQEHPEQLHKWGDEIVLDAINSAWPCGK